MVEAGGGRGEEDGITRLCEAAGALDRFVHAAAVFVSDVGSGEGGLHGAVVHADEQDVANAAGFDDGGELGEVLVFADAARDEDDGAVNACQRCGSGADIGRFGVVHPVHAAFCGDGLHAVRQAGEGFDGGQGLAGTYAVGFEHEQGAEDVAVVVRAVQVEAGGIENAVAVQDDFAVFDAVRQGRRVAVVDDVLSLFGGGDAVFVVTVDDGNARLAHEVGFGGGVGGEVVVAVEVVGGDVEDGGDARVERGAEFELVAGEVEDVAVSRFAVKEGIEHGAADVAAEFGALSCMVEGGGKQGDDGAFAVAAGHGQHGFVV